MGTNWKPTDPIPAKASEKVVVTGNKDGATCEEFTDYVIAALKDIL